jgi:hypothetical protein
MGGYVDCSRKNQLYPKHIYTDMRVTLANRMVFVVAILFLSSCDTFRGEDGVDGDFDKVVRIPLEPVTFDQFNSSDWEGNFAYGLIHDFNKDEYIGVDRAIFIAQIERTFPGTDSIGIRLYDHTNDAPIEDSEIWSNASREDYQANPDIRVLESNDFFANLPDGEITIGMQKRKTQNIETGFAINIWRAELLLYRSSDAEASLQVGQLLKQLKAR